MKEWLKKRVQEIITTTTINRAERKRRESIYTKRTLGNQIKCYWNGKQYLWHEPLCNYSTLGLMRFVCVVCIVVTTNMVFMTIFGFSFNKYKHIHTHAVDSGIMWNGRIDPKHARFRLSSKQRCFFYFVWLCPHEWKPKESR